jgi:hypothetical protein
MEDPGKKKRSWIVDVILILLIIILAYVLYTFVGGGWTPGDMAGDADIFKPIAEFGQGLRDMFGKMVP